MTTLAYFIDVFYASGESEYVWIPACERESWVGRPDVAAATFSPAVRAQDTCVTAWLIEGIDPGPFVVAKERTMVSALQLGAVVTPLRLTRA